MVSRHPRRMRTRTHQPAAAHLVLTVDLGEDPSAGFRTTSAGHAHVEEGGRRAFLGFAPIVAHRYTSPRLTRVYEEALHEV